uniref:Uncharacterized protein n=1 Tax=Arundo donax TaxID=35708 RepID=A0A0A9FLI9_ARUDO
MLFTQTIRKTGPLVISNLEVIAFQIILILHKTQIRTRTEQANSGENLLQQVHLGSSLHFDEVITVSMTHSWTCSMVSSANSP